MLFFSSSPDSQPSDKWEILPEQIEFEGELGRGAFGVVYKATFRQRVEMQVLYTETSKRPLLSTKKAPQVVAVKVLHGKKYCSLHKEKAFDFATYFQFFLCNGNDFFLLIYPFGPKTPKLGKYVNKNQCKGLKGPEILRIR